MLSGGLNGEITAERLRLLESLHDEAIRIKNLKALKIKERYDKRVHSQ